MYFSVHSDLLFFKSADLLANMALLRFVFGSVWEAS